MHTSIELVLKPEDYHNSDTVKSIVCSNLKISDKEKITIITKKKSIDARSRNIVFRVKYDVFINEEPENELFSLNAKPLSDKKAIVIGFGPAGMFAALKLLECGIKPIILERGKDVRARRLDLRNIQQNDTVNPDSNYCFGEGGAGTYSDGKLYTRSNKRGDINRILQILIRFGALDEILYDSHPHIGSNKLPKIITALREFIVQNGGEIHFGKRVIDLIIKDSIIKGIISSDLEEYHADAVILSTGHSAKDIYYLLKKKNIYIERKLFALGVRIEHPQALIDEIQYHRKERGEYLPAASYSLTCQIDKRGVFSFCMCPGGLIVPASTSPNELVLNGMSLSRRDSPFSNSGLVVQVQDSDYTPFAKYEEFAGIELQKAIEQKCSDIGERTQQAPAQRVTDFIKGKTSSILPKSSYIPGTFAANIRELFPLDISESLRQGLIEIGKKKRGFITEEALLLAPETRTSSPLRIPRSPENFMHPQIKGLFPCGEGAGYAGGIVSAAIDGENTAEYVNKYLCGA